MSSSQSQPPPHLSDTSRWFQHYSGNDGLLSQDELIAALVDTFGSGGTSTNKRSHFQDTVVAIWPAFDDNSSGYIEQYEFCRPGGMGESLLAAYTMQQEQERQRPQHTPHATVPVQSPSQQQQHPSVYVPPESATSWAPHSVPRHFSAPPEVESAQPKTKNGENNDDSDFFICRNCTFVNKASESTCKACGSINPKAPSSRRVVTTTTTTPMNTTATTTTGQSSFVSQQHVSSYQQQQQQQQPYIPPPPQQQQTQPYVPLSLQQTTPSLPAPVSPPTAAAAPPPHRPAITTTTFLQPPSVATTSSVPPIPSSDIAHNVQTTTFRVLIPYGMEPGQCIQVRTGTASNGDNNNSRPTTIVTIPHRRHWGRRSSDDGGQWYFDVQLSKDTTPSTTTSANVTNNHTTATATPTCHYASSQSTSNSSSSSGHPKPNHHHQATTTQSHHYGHSNAAMSSLAPPKLHTNSHSSGAAGAALISSQHISSTSRTLVLKERAMSYSGDDVSIKDASDGTVVFYAQAELMTLSQRRNLVAANGQKVGQLRHKKTPSLHPTVYVGPPSDEKMYAIQMSGMLNPMNCNAKILTTSNNNQVTGTIVGNWRAKTFTITIHGTVVAKVKRKRTASSIFMGADTYCIDVQPGVDLAFVSLVVIALDELYNDDRGGRHGGGGIGGSFGPGW